MKYLLIVIFLLTLNIVNAQTLNFDSLCNACKAERDRRNFCKFRIDSTVNKYSPPAVSKEFNFFKLLSVLLAQKRINRYFDILIENSIKKYFVFMRMDYKLDSANLTLHQYVFQSANSYGNIIFLVDKKNIISTGLNLENKKEMICISKNDTLNFTVNEIDYDYYRQNVFPALGQFSSKGYKCGYFYSDNYFKLDDMRLVAKREKVKRFD
jgi:hypothetical protein